MEEETALQLNAMAENIAVLDVVSSEKAKLTLDQLPPISSERRAQTRNDHALDLAHFELPLSTDSPPTMLYLAYGSNLSAKTFKGVRGIRPISQLNVVAPEIRLTFDLPGIPYQEPCFANVERRASQSVSEPASTHDEKQSLIWGPYDYRKKDWEKGLVGVVYEVSREDFATIIRTEGAGSSYSDIVVNCYPLLDVPSVPRHPDTSPFKAHTLYCPRDPEQSMSTEPHENGGRLHRPDPNYAQASMRYMGLLKDGASEHKLPSEYQQYLASIRYYRITTRMQRIGRAIFVSIWHPVIMALFAFQHRLADKRGRIPKWAVTISNFIFRSVWNSYDYVFKPIFGDGERTISDEMVD